jgi:multidrug efflux pump subunit AcrA (membrane-fusion protein)
MKRTLLAGLLFLFFSCKQKEETTTPVVQTITESVYASGRVKSKDQYEAFAPVAGIIRTVHVAEGDIVRRGDPLLSLVNESAQLSAENARIAARYQSVSANTERLQEAQAAINLASERLQLDSSLLERQRQLWKEGIGTRNELEQRELAVKNAATNHRTAVLRYRQLQDQLSFAEKQAQKNLQISSTVAGDYVVRAKQDGRVYSLPKKVGEVVGPQIPVAIVGSAGDFMLELQVDEYDLARLAMGQKVMVGLDSYKGQAFEAIVSRIEPIVNERTRSITVEAQFTKAPPTLYPNLSVEANVLIQAKEGAITIPRSYLVDETHVLLQNGEKRKVEVGLKDYQKAEIISGLGKDEVIKKPAP